MNIKFVLKHIALVLIGFIWGFSSTVLMWGLFYEDNINQIYKTLYWIFFGLPYYASYGLMVTFGEPSNGLLAIALLTFLPGVISVYFLYFLKSKVFGI